MVKKRSGGIYTEDPGINQDDQHQLRVPQVTEGTEKQTAGGNKADVPVSGIGYLLRSKDDQASLT